MFQAFILGMIQGLGEFLPISSSAHLILAPWLFGWPDQGLAFDVALHWGTLFAVLAYFRRDVWHIFIGFIHTLSPRTRDVKNNIYQKLSWLILIATMPAVIVGKIFEHQVETNLRNPLLIATTLGVVGLILLVADKMGSKQKNLNHLTTGNSFVIGLAQAVSIIPGISRSGSTMIAGLFQGLTREDAAKFSFLMSIPIILGAGVLKLPDIAHQPNTGEVLVGFITSLVFGFLSIKFLLRYIAKKSYAIFTWYRLGLAAFIIVVYLLR